MQEIRLLVTVLLAVLGVPTAAAPAAAQGAAAGLPIIAWIGIVALVVLGALLGYLLWWREDNRGSHADDVPPLLFPAAPASQPRRVRREPVGFPVAAPAAGPAEPLRGPAPAPAPEPVAPSPLSPLSATAAPVAPPAPADAFGGAVVDGRTVRFHQPTDGTLQILPGRLEIVTGSDSGQSIRFVRTPGEPQITFGRSDGPPYRHIQLRARTVSRTHAVMRLDGSQWSIENLSRTNPVVVNGEELEPDGDSRLLEEGDRIEMGEIIFVFRER